MGETVNLWTIRDVLSWTSGYLQRQRIEQPRLEAEVLLSRALGKTRVEIYMNLDKPLAKNELAAYRSLIQRRAERMPTAYLMGEKEFMSLTFQVNRQVLIPRPETEILVEEAIRRLTERAEAKGEAPLMIADVGTGSGNIAITLAKRFPTARVVAIDISAGALEVAERNAVRHGVEQRIIFLEGDLLRPLEQLETGCRFDLIAANLPYISSTEIPHLPREVLFEPIIALDGGKDGLLYYRKLIPQAQEYLAPQGLLLLELGSGQAKAARKLFPPESWEPVRIIPDYAGHERVLVANRSSDVGIEGIRSTNS